MPFASLALPALGNLLTYFQKDHQFAEDKQRHIEEQRQVALKALYAALIKTHSYQDAQPDGIDRDKRLELSNLWASAAIESRAYLQSKSLDEPWIMDKAQYWIDNIEWSDEEVHAKKIDLETVQQRIRELIDQK